MATLTWGPNPRLPYEIHAKKGDVLYKVTRHTAFGFTQNKNVAYAGDLKLGTFESDIAGLTAAKLACQAYADAH